MSVSAELKDILVCPKCKGQLEFPDDREEIDCRSCRLAYPVDDGVVPVMIPEEARILEARHGP